LLRDLVERLARAAEQPRRAAVNEHDAPLARLADGRQRGEVRAVGDDRLVVDRLGEAQHLEEAGGAAGEDRHAVRALRPGAVAELCGDALEIALQGLLLLVRELLGLLAHEAPGAVEQRADLGAAGRRRRELARVEVEEEGEDLRAADVDFGEPAQAIPGDVVGLHESDTTPAAHRVRRGRAPQRPIVR
jgi:hypothetical protein